MEEPPGLQGISWTPQIQRRRNDIGSNKWSKEVTEGGIVAKDHEKASQQLESFDNGSIKPNVTPTDIASSVPDIRVLVVLRSVE